MLRVEDRASGRGASRASLHQFERPFASRLERVQPSASRLDVAQFFASRPHTDRTSQTYEASHGKPDLRISGGGIMAFWMAYWVAEQMAYSFRCRVRQVIVRKLFRLWSLWTVIQKGHTPDLIRFSL